MPEDDPLHTLPDHLHRPPSNLGRPRFGGLAWGPAGVENPGCPDGSLGLFSVPTALCADASCGQFAVGTCDRDSPPWPLPLKGSYRGDGGWEERSLTPRKIVGTLPFEVLLRGQEFGDTRPPPKGRNTSTKKEIETNQKAEKRNTRMKKEAKGIGEPQSGEASLRPSSDALQKEPIIQGQGLQAASPATNMSPAAKVPRIESRLHCNGKNETPRCGPGVRPEMRSPGKSQPGIHHHRIARERNCARTVKG